jgi:hypothetical protein
MALKLDNSLIDELGLGALPEHEKQLLLRQIYEKLEMNVGVRLADQMSNEQLDEFEKFVDANDDKGAFQWLETNFPNYKDVVNEEFEKLKAEIKQYAPQMLAVAQQNANQPAGAQGPAPQSGFGQPPMPGGAPNGAYPPQYGQQQPAPGQYQPGPQYGQQPNQPMGPAGGQYGQPNPYYGPQSQPNYGQPAPGAAGPVPQQFGPQPSQPFPGPAPQGMPQQSPQYPPFPQQQPPAGPSQQPQKDQQDA